jgi:hypothetical protein
MSHSNDVRWLRARQALTARVIYVTNDAAYLPAVAALAGSAIGGFTSLASAWLTQRHQDRAILFLQDKGRRQLLYKQFIDESSKLYADALMHDKSDISALVSVYALIGQLRILSSLAVVE